MKKIVWLLIVSAIAIASCKREKSTSIYFLSPQEGSNIAQEKEITLKLDAEAGSFDSIQYLIDVKHIASKTDTTAVILHTTGIALGTRILTARVYSGGVAKEVTTNIVVLPKAAPAKLTYSIINVFPHDTSSFIEGLEFHDNVFYESAGLKGESSLRKVDPKTGKVLQIIKLDANYFAEGITIVDDKIIQLTYQEGVGFVYDKTTFTKLKEFPYQAGREGWGLAFDGKSILNTDGTSNIYYLNKDTYQKETAIEVFNNTGAVNQLNELEYINGKIYANVWQTDKIVVINPATGVIEAELDLSNLYPITSRNATADVLNGIAWDAAGKRLFVTGKKWDKLFEIKIN